MNRVGSSRSGAIDALRALAAISVVLYHFNLLPVSGEFDRLGRFWSALWSHGHLGVPAFFVLSGYCIGASWLTERSAFRFAAKRFKRIYPAYWTSLLVVLIVAIFRKSISGVNDVAILPREAWEILATLAILTQPASPVQPMFGVYWTLTFEIAFYAVMLALMMAKNRQFTLVVASTLMTAGAVVGIGPFFIHLWPIFSLGLALALWPANRAASVGLFAGGAVYAIAQITKDDWSYVAAGLATALLIPIMRNWKVPRVFSAIGESSYSLYLIHVPLGFHVIARLMPVADNRGGVAIAAQMSGLVMLLIISRAIYVSIERPALNGQFSQYPKPARSTL